MSVVDPVVIEETIEPPDAQIVLLVPDELEYFDGHFPGTPIVPGVVQIKWALASAARCLGLVGDFAGMEALKFQQVLGPRARVTLVLKHDVAAGKLHFAFESEQGRHSSGRLLFRRLP